MLDRVEASGLAAHATPVKPTMPLRPLLPPMPVRRMAGATAMAGAEEMWSPAPTPASAPAPETESAPIPMPRRPVRTRAEIAESATDIPGEDYETEIDNVFADVFEPQTSGTPRNPTDPEGGQNA